MLLETRMGSQLKFHFQKPHKTVPLIPAGRHALIISFQFCPGTTPFLPSHRYSFCGRTEQNHNFLCPELKKTKIYYSPLPQWKIHIEEVL